MNLPSLRPGSGSLPARPPSRPPSTSGSRPGLDPVLSWCFAHGSEEFTYLADAPRRGPGCVYAHAGRGPCDVAPAAVVRVPADATARDVGSRDDANAGLRDDANAGLQDDANAIVQDDRDVLQ